jgi:hypothetical protein
LACIGAATTNFNPDIQFGGRRRRPDQVFPKRILVPEIVVNDEQMGARETRDSGRQERESLLSRRALGQRQKHERLFLLKLGGLLRYAPGANVF